MAAKAISPQRQSLESWSSVSQRLDSRGIYKRRSLVNCCTWQLPLFPVLERLGLTLELSYDFKAVVQRMKDTLP